MSELRLGSMNMNKLNHAMKNLKTCKMASNYFLK